MTDPPLLPLPLPGVGGRIKAEPVDFEVEEIPAYEPSGTGDHLFLWIEKTDLGAEYFIRQVARRLGIPNGEVGTAGLKDRRAVTRQWVSVPATFELALPSLEGHGIRVLRVSRHANKLRPGHLRGNRFCILIRDANRSVDPQPILDRIAAEGLSNFFGPQRFGRGGETPGPRMSLPLGGTFEIR